MEEKIKLGLVEDETMFRESIARYLSVTREIDVEIVLEAANGAEMFEKLEKIKTAALPEIILLDIVMPEMDGMKTTRRLRKKYPLIKIIVLTAHRFAHYVKEMIQLGVKGYLHKNLSADKLIPVIEMVANGEKYFDPEIAGIIVGNKKERKKYEMPVLLTKKQKNILSLLVNGCKTKEIAAKMFLSERTIEGYRNQLMVLLDAKNTIHLISIAYRKGLID